MARTRGGINPLKQNIFSNRKFATEKEIANACNRCSIIIKLVNSQSKKVQIKDKQENILRKMTIRRRTIYPPKRKRERY